MSEIIQGIIIGVVSTLFVCLFMGWLLIKHIELKWEHTDLKAVMALNFFLTRNKWKAYYLTVFK